MARQFGGQVTGYDLPRDLGLVVTKNNPVCFDIGANRGQTIQLLQHCFRAPVIHAFEPASTSFEALASQSFGSGVCLHQLALGEQVGVAEFHNYAHSELNSFLTIHSDKRENLFAEESVVSVESVRVDTLDNVCAAHKITQIDLFKIDTQGFELPVLRGAVSLFNQQKISAVLLELNFTTLYEGQSDPLEILQLLRSHNLRLVDFYEKERITGAELSWTTALFRLHL
ncbi:MAG: FkbM family methyltransferase [Rudanella sp.]|nr:FkbM family methyltransferase [Rudanella sp.]